MRTGEPREVAALSEMEGVKPRMNSHEPIILDADEWPKSFPLVQHTLNRLANNAHEDRTRVQSVITGIEVKIEQRFGELHTDIECRRKEVDERRESDLLRIGDRYDPIFSRLSAAETRATLYGAIGGAFASGLVSALIAFFFRK
jgi:hypothetical protein